MFLNLSDVRDETAHCFSAVVRSEDGEVLETGGEGQFVYKGYFEDHVAPDRGRSYRDHFIKRGLIEAVWGYAITCHKAQGSAWPNVIVFDDGLGRTTEDRARWLYTAITRAEKGLVILD
jgi:exodeoxyribonuclease-5